jgi:hypothetical protein
MATSIIPTVSGVTSSTRKPAGRPPVFNGRNVEKVISYASAVNRPVAIAPATPGRLPTFNGANADECIDAYSRGAKLIPVEDAPKFGPGRVTAEEAARRAEIRAQYDMVKSYNKGVAAVQKFNARLTRAD